MPSSGDNVAVFWDYENCEVPTDISPYYAIWEIYRVAEKYGTVKLFNAYLEAANAKPAFRSDLQSSEVRLVDCPHFGKKDVADTMILVDMFAYALDNPGRSTTIILISGDGDFTRALITLTRREYRVVLISPAQVSRVLARTASVLLDWTTDVLKNQPRSRTGSSRSGPPSHYYTSEEEDWAGRIPREEDGYSSYESDYGKSMKGLPTPDDSSDDSDREDRKPSSSSAVTPKKPRRKVLPSRPLARPEIKRASDLPPTPVEATPIHRSSKRDTFFKEEQDLASRVNRLTLEERITGSSSQSSNSDGTGYASGPDDGYKDICDLEDMKSARHFDREATPKRPTAGRAGRPTRGRSGSRASPSPTKSKSKASTLSDRIAKLPPPVRVSLSDRITSPPSSPAPSMSSFSSSGSSLSNSTLPPTPTSPTPIYSPKQKEYYSQIFSPLISTLRLELSRGHERSQRNAIAPMMLAAYGLDGVGEIYERANCARGGFREFLERARNVGVVQCGGVGEGKWVALSLDWE